MSTMYLRIREIERVYKNNFGNLVIQSKEGDFIEYENTELIKQFFIEQEKQLTLTIEKEKQNG